MSNVMRWRQGDTKPVFMAPASATVIEIGDLLYLDPTTSKPKNAAAMTDQGSEALNQDAFQQYFLGVAEQQSRSGDTDPIRIATAGVFEFICAAATWTPGDLVAVDEAASGTALEDQTVVAGASESLAIGVAETLYSSNTTIVRVEIRSTIMRESIQAQVAGSSSGAI